MCGEFQLEVSRRILRKVEVKTQVTTYEAWFHCWFATSQDAIALLELKDGSMVGVEYSKITFIK